ncbi:MAG: hypothetical protein V4507_16100 [Verrucomicrobiota bacterium]
MMLRLLLCFWVLSRFIGASEGVPIKIPNAVLLLDMLTDLNSTVNNKGDLLAQMQLYTAFEKPFENWDGMDFILFQNAISKYAQEGRVGRGVKYPDHLVQQTPLIISKLREIHEILPKEGENAIILQNYKIKISEFDRRLSRGQIQVNDFQSLEESKQVILQLDVYAFGSNQKTKDQLLRQIEHLLTSKEGYVQGEKRTAQQKEVDRLKEIEFQKEEAHSRMIRNWIIGVGVLIGLIFWWVSRSGRAMD